MLNAIENNKVYILGIGPGSKEFVPPVVQKILSRCNVLIGGHRNLSLFEDILCEKIEIRNNLSEIEDYINSNIKSKTIGVIASGDPCFFGIMKFLKNKIGEDKVIVIPGISSISYLCSKALITFEDMVFESVHGRGDPSSLILAVINNKKIGVFTDKNYRPEVICKMLIENGFEDLCITVGENLSYENERIVKGTLDIIANSKFEDLCVMIIENKNHDLDTKESNTKNIGVPGIPDEYFIRGTIPMTKEEVRAVSLSKLRIKENDIIYDIGAGTGSISIESAILSKKGVVYSFEKEEEGVLLIKKNKEKFQLKNIIVVSGEAPNTLDGKTPPDKVFVGGSGDHLLQILDKLCSLNKSFRIVINSITIETSYLAIKSLEDRGFSNIDILNMSVAKNKKAGSKNMMLAQNPVYIISGDYILPFEGGYDERK